MEQRFYFPAQLVIAAASFIKKCSPSVLQLEGSVKQAFNAEPLIGFRWGDHFRTVILICDLDPRSYSANLGGFAVEFAVQPGFAHFQLAVHCGGGDFERCRGLVIGEAAKA
jgi:hypothetical protein